MEEAGESRPLLLSWAMRETLAEALPLLPVSAALELDAPDNPEADMLAKCGVAQPRRERLDDADAPAEMTGCQSGLKLDEIDAFNYLS